MFLNLYRCFILDLGLEPVKEFLSQTVLPHIEQKDVFFYDYKSELNQLCDHESLDLTYDLVHEEGEPHNKTFTMAAIINGENYGTGSGGSKKEAEQNAAKMALINFNF